MKRSRWQPLDLFYLLLFFVPVRCHSCWIRTHRNLISVAFRRKKPLPYMVLNDTTI